jgi:hypothetical protein
MWNEIALEELDENTNKSTKFCFNKRSKWKYEQKHHILVENFQTWLILLIPNCTRHRMITYTYNRRAACFIEGRLVGMDELHTVFS